MYLLLVYLKLKYFINNCLNLVISNMCYFNYDEEEEIIYLFF